MAATTRVTIVLPNDLWEEAKRLVPSGERSRFVAKALEAEIRKRKRLKQLEEIRKCAAYMREKYGQTPSSIEDIRDMREERDEQISGLH